MRKVWILAAALLFAVSMQAAEPTAGEARSTMAVERAQSVTISGHR